MPYDLSMLFLTCPYLLFFMICMHYVAQMECALGDCLYCSRFSVFSQAFVFYKEL